ncbi:hypothetical protein E0H82_09565 [Acinetobacter sp. ANC 4910]|nr:hypothetical protein E0H82_09565 [Acinetobacter sp. ANC 4910]
MMKVLCHLTLQIVSGCAIYSRFIIFLPFGLFMKNTSSSNDTESTVLGWKFIVIVGAITTIFFTFLYLAMSSDPEYMPNREPKVAAQPTTAPAQPTQEFHPATHDSKDDK